MADKQTEVASATAGSAGTVPASADWRVDTLARLRTLIRAANLDIVEDVKWRKPTNPAGVPVWSHTGILCTGETYKDKVKLTFAKGALLEDPSGLFNASLEGSMRRAIDIGNGVAIDETAFKHLILAAVRLNMTGHPERTRAVDAD